jgi:two-component system, NarL family, response regulator DevR
MNVFVVEDSPSIRDLIRMSVEDAGGMIIGEAATQQEAITLIGVLNPDVVVIDLRLPDGNGIEVTRAVKQTHPGITMIVLTNQARHQVEQACLDAGADHFFEKSSTDYLHFRALLNQLSDTARKTASRRV